MPKPKPKKVTKIHTLTHLETGVTYQFHHNDKECVVKLTARRKTTTHTLDVEEGRFLYRHLRTEGYVKL